MIIKKSIVGSLFSMLLVSEMAAADWGDVYYCQMTNFIGITLEGERKFYKQEKFQFKLDQTTNAMVMGSTGYFTDMVYELNTGMSFPSQEKWYANHKFSMTRFAEGKFFYSQVGTGIVSISADCDKF